MIENEIMICGDYEYIYKGSEVESNELHLLALL